MEFFWIKNPSNNMEIDVPLMENLPNNVNKYSFIMKNYV